MKTSQLMGVMAVVIGAPHMSKEWAAFCGVLALVLGFVSLWRER